MKWILGAIGTWVLLQYMQTGQLALPMMNPVMATPGSQIPLYGGMSITVPGGTTSSRNRARYSLTAAALACTRMAASEDRNGNRLSRPE